MWRVPSRPTVAATPSERGEDAIHMAPDRPHHSSSYKRLISTRMVIGAVLVGAASAFVALSVLPPGGGAAPSRTTKPEHLSTVVRYNASDRDAQLIFSLKDENQAIGPISLLRPNGAKVLDERLSNPSALGQSILEVKTADGVPLRRLERAYPAGSYRWVGRTVDGKRVGATTRVSYALPRPPTIIAPSDEAKGLPTSGVTLRWRPVPDAEAIFMEVEEDADDGRELLMRLDGETASLTVPDGFLENRADYDVEIKAVAPNGNQTAVDTTFSTG
jgi:hypothetical protein